MTYEKKTKELLKNRIQYQKFIEIAENEVNEMEGRIVILKQRSHILGIEGLSTLERQEWGYHYELTYRIKFVRDLLALIDRGLSVLTENEKGLLLAHVDGGSAGLLEFAEQFLGIERSSAYRDVKIALEKATLSIFGLLGSCD